MYSLLLFGLTRKFAMCSFCHLDFVKTFPRFGLKSRLKSANFGSSRLKQGKIGQDSTQIRLKFDQTASKID